MLLLSTTRTSIASNSMPFCETNEFNVCFRLSPRLYVQIQIESLGDTECRCLRYLSIKTYAIYFMAGVCENSAISHVT